LNEYTYFQKSFGLHHCVELTLEKHWVYIMQFDGYMNVSSQMLRFWGWLEKNSGLF